MTVKPFNVKHQWLTLSSQAQAFRQNGMNEGRRRGLETRETNWQKLKNRVLSRKIECQKGTETENRSGYQKRETGGFECKIDLKLKVTN